MKFRSPVSNKNTCYSLYTCNAHPRYERRGVFKVATYGSTVFRAPRHHFSRAFDPDPLSRELRRKRLRAVKIALRPRVRSDGPQGGFAWDGVRSLFFVLRRSEPVSENEERPFARRRFACAVLTGFYIFAFATRRVRSGQTSGRIKGPNGYPARSCRVNLFSARGGPCRGGVVRVPVNRRNIGNRKTHIYIYLFTHPPSVVGLSILVRGIRRATLCVKNPLLLFVLSAKRVPATELWTYAPNRFYFAFTRRFWVVWTRNTRLLSKVFRLLYPEKSTKH